MTTIPLAQPAPTVEDLNLLVNKANEPCYCKSDMQSTIHIDRNPTTCLPCACRFALNAIGSVAHEVKMEFN